MLPFNKKRLFRPSHLPQLQLTWMKEKSSSLSAGQASEGGGPSGPSVDSSSELERSALELRRSLELSCCSTDVDSVYEDKWLLGGCFPADAALLSGDDGDSGPKLHGRQETTALIEGPRTLNPKPGVMDTWLRVFRLGTAGVFLLATVAMGHLHR